MGIDGIDLNAMMKTSVVLGVESFKLYLAGLYSGGTPCYLGQRSARKETGDVWRRRREKTCHVTICLGLPFFFVLLDKKNKSRNSKRDGRVPIHM